MTPEEESALVDVKGYATSGRVLIPGHARRRLAERGADEEDLLHALKEATGCAFQAPDRWRVSGPDLDGDSLTAVVVLEAGVVVVTLF